MTFKQIEIWRQSFKSVTPSWNNIIAEKTNNPIPQLPQILNSNHLEIDQQH